MSLLKKITAALMSAAMLISLSACGESTTWGAKINDTELRAGIYIYYSMNAYYEAQKFLTEGQTDIFAINIEDKPAVQWMQDKATASMQEYVAYEEKFDELGLTLSEDEVKATTKSVEDMLEAYKSYYGLDYEKYGISKQSNIDISINGLKKEAVFNYYYGDGGTEAVPEDDIKQYMKDNYAYVNYIQMQLKDGSGNLLKSDGKAKIKTMSEDYIERAKSGEDFNKIAAEYNTYYSNLQAEAQAAAAASTETNSAETSGSIAVETSPAKVEPAQDESNETTAASTEVTSSETTAQVTEAAADTANTVTDNAQVIKKDAENPLPSKTVNDKVFGGTLKDGDIVLIEEDEAYYVLKYMDLFSKEGYYDEQKSTVLHEMKDEEFDALVATWTASQKVEINQKAYDRYDVKKFSETETSAK